MGMSKEMLRVGIKLEKVLMNYDVGEEFTFPQLWRAIGSRNLGRFFQRYRSEGMIITEVRQTAKGPKKFSKKTPKWEPLWLSQTQEEAVDEAVTVSGVVDEGLMPEVKFMAETLFKGIAKIDAIVTKANEDPQREAIIERLKASNKEANRQTCDLKRELRDRDAELEKARSIIRDQAEKIRSLSQGRAREIADLKRQLQLRIAPEN